MYIFNKNHNERGREWRMKNVKRLALILTAAMMIAGCSGGKAEIPKSGETEKKPEAPAPAQSQPGQEKVETEVVQEVTGENAENMGDPNVWIKGEVTLGDKKVVIKGTSNLPADLTLKGEISAKGYNMFGYRGDAKTENDGSFEMEIQKPDIKKDDLMNVNIMFKPENEAEPVQKIYGEKGEKLTGAYIYQYENSGEMYKMAAVKADFRGSDTAISLAEPSWEVPQDQGSAEVWIEPVVTKDADHYYVSGRSNLLEGTKVWLNIDLPGRWHVGYSDSVPAAPDGSFKLQIKKPKNVKDMYILVQMKPDEDMWPAAQEAYGKKGEKLKGKLVKTEQTDQGPLKYVQVKIKVKDAE